MLQKGGVGKTTLTGILAFLLKKQGMKVLVVDMDSQGNVSSLLLKESVYKFSNETILEAVEDQNPKPYIVTNIDGIDVIPADDLLSIYGRRIYEIKQSDGRSGNQLLYLRQTIDLVADQYDYILIDCPPSLNEQTLSALASSDYVVTVLQSEVYAYQALTRFFETLFFVKKMVNPSVVMIGIAVGLTDRQTLQDMILEESRDTYGDLVFQTVIRRLARIAEFSTLGISDHYKEQRIALEQYQSLLNELLDRIQCGYRDESIYYRALENRLTYVEEKLADTHLDSIKRSRFEGVREEAIENLKIAKEWL